MLVRLDRLRLQAHLAHEPGGINLTAIDADAPDYGIRLGEYRVGGTGNVICTRGAHIADASNYRDIALLELHDGTPDLVRCNRAATRRGNAYHERLGTARQVSQSLGNLHLHARVDSPVNIQERNARTLAPRFVKDLARCRLPVAVARLRGVHIEELLERVSRHLVDIEQRIHKPRPHSRGRRDHRGRCQRIEGTLDPEGLARVPDCNHRGDSLPEVGVEFLAVLARLGRHRVCHVGFHRRLVGSVLEEFHLHANLIEQALVEERVTAEAAPGKVRRGFCHNAINGSRSQQYRQTNIVHVGDHLRAACPQGHHHAVYFTRYAKVPAVAGKIKNHEARRRVAHQVLEQVPHLRKANIAGPEEGHTLALFHHVGIEGHAHNLRKAGRPRVTRRMVAEGAALRQKVVEHGQGKIVVAAKRGRYREAPFVVAVKGHLECKSKPVEAKFQEKPVVLEILPVVAYRKVVAHPEGCTKAVDTVLRLRAQIEQVLAGVAQREEVHRPEQKALRHGPFRTLEIRTAECRHARTPEKHAVEHRERIRGTPAGLIEALAVGTVVKTDAEPFRVRPRTQGGHVVIELVAKQHALGIERRKGGRVTENPVAAILRHEARFARNVGKRGAYGHKHYSK